MLALGLEGLDARVPWRDTFCFERGVESFVTEPRERFEGIPYGDDLVARIGRAGDLKDQAGGWRLAGTQASGDNSRRLAQVAATRMKVIEAAQRLFTENGYPATTIETVAEVADTPLPTVYRRFGSKRALLAAVLDTAFGGDDQPIAFGDRPAVRAARAEPDPAEMTAAFARIVAEFMQRSSAILNVLATAAQVDPEAAELLAQIRRQRYTGQSRIVAALRDTGALDPDLDTDEADDIVYALLSPEVHLILMVERGWPADRYERWIARSLRTLLRTG